MPKKLCVIHANCQGDPVMQLLASHPEFSQQFIVRKYTNYLHEEIPAEDLAGCELFLYQHLGEKWGDHSSDALLAQVNDTAQRMAIPNVLWKGYWPFWTNRSPMDFGDAFLDRLIDMGLGKNEILYMYLTADITTKYDLGEMFAQTVAFERGKEEGCVVQCVDVLLEHYRTEMVCNTINHPGQRLVLHMTNGILQALGMKPVSEKLAALLGDPYPELHLPIHPQVAKFHGLEFVGEDTKFYVYGKQKTFAEYVNHYIDCRLLGLDNFIGYLHLA